MTWDEQESHLFEELARNQRLHRLTQHEDFTAFEELWYDLIQEIRDLNQIDGNADFEVAMRRRLSSCMEAMLSAMKGSKEEANRHSKLYDKKRSERYS